MGLQVTRHVNAPLDKTFAAATDLTNAEKNISGILKMEILTDGPVGAGTRFRETRIMFGKEATEVMEIGEFNPPSGYTVDAESHGCKYHSEFTFAERDGGTDMTMTFEAYPQTFLAKLMGVLTRLFQKKMCDLIGKDLDDIKAVAERR